MAASCLIGIDVGTTSVKAALFDLSGTVLRSYASGYPTARPGPGYVEQNPADWMTHVLAGLETVTRGVDRAEIAAVGLCSQVNTHVFVGADGEALMPAILWQDGRCAEEALALDARVPEQDRLAWWGAPLPIDASHVLGRMAWVKAHRPEVWAKTRWVMLPKDHCLLQLTGEACADPMSNFGMVDGKLAYIPKLMSLAQDGAGCLPPLKGITAAVGRIRSGLPGAGLPVVNATMDAWTGLIGAGASQDGDAVYLSGTSEVGAIVSDRKVPTPGVIAFPRCEGIVLHAGPTQSGGASVTWLCGVLDNTPDEISALAARSDFSKPAPIFLPHLAGERAPLWDIAARGAFAGLDASMGAPELARSVLEGVAYSVRLLLDSLEHSAAKSVEVLRHSGGGAASDIWCQIRANVLGRRLERAVNRDSGVLGAAMLAGVGCGLFVSIPEAAKQLVKVDRVFEPQPHTRAMYDDGFSRYTGLYKRLKGFTG